MQQVSEKITSNNKPLSEQLFTLVKLVSQKYELESVQARFDDLESNTVNVVLFNGRHGVNDQDVDSENTNPIEYLKTFGGQVAKEPYKYSY